MNTDSDRFLKNIGWLGLSEGFVRFTRLGTAVVLARVLDPVTFGIAALVLTVNELVHVFNRNGIGAKIVQCDTAELDEIVETAYRMGFVICTSLFVLQCLLAYPIAEYYESPALTPMLQVLALVYLIMPFGLVQSALVQRAQRMKTKALIEGVQIGIDNILTALLAIGGLGAWAIVLPKLLVAPIWLIGYRKAIHWSPSGKFIQFAHWKEILKFGRFFLGIEVLKTARLNLDNLIIANFLGIEALGLYYFARNAGLGFSMSLINAMSAALYPNLCELKTNTEKLKTRFLHNLKRVSSIVSPLILLQTLLAPWYVPIVFGPQWDEAIPILMLLCFSAVLRPLGESASALALATEHIQLDFRWNLMFTLIFIVIAVLGAQSSLLAVAFGIAALYTITQPLYCRFVYQQVFKRPIENS
ncbi:MAG: teichuronic acid exporter [Arenicella sp.]|jgi:teichuronic acid exporter